MGKRVLFLAAFLAMVASPSFSVTINFGGAGSGGAATTITNQYASQGVVFSGLVADDLCGGGYCGVLQNINVGGIQYNAPVTVTFENGGVMGTTQNISLALSDGNIGTGLVTWSAYDINGGLLATQTIVTTTGATQIVSISASDVHRLVLEDDGDGSLFTQMDYDSVVPYEDGQNPPHMPEPSAALLFGLGAYALSRRTRRMR